MIKQAIFTWQTAYESFLYSLCSFHIRSIFQSPVNLICCQKHKPWPYETDRIRERGEEREKKTWNKLNKEVLTFCDILSVTFGALALQVISMNGWNGRDKHKSLDLNWDGNGLLECCNSIHHKHCLA